MGVDFTDNGVHQRLHLYGKQTGQQVEQIGLLYGGNKLQHCEKKNDKRNRGEYNKKGCLSGIHRDLIPYEFIIYLFAVYQKIDHKFLHLFRFY